MGAAATKIYTGQGLSPCIYPELARTDAGRYLPGTYVAGQVLGQKTGLTAVNEVQTITFTGTPTGGTFRLTFNGVETANITFVAVAATLAANITAALEALPQIGTGNVTTSASLTVPAVTFQGALAGQEQPALSVSRNDMTSGTTAGASVAETTPGQTAGGAWGAYDDAASNGLQIAKAINQYALTVTPDGKHYSGGGNTGNALLCASFYIQGYFRTADLTGIDAAGVADLGKIKEGDIGALTNVATILHVI